MNMITAVRPLPATERARLAPLPCADATVAGASRHALSQAEKAVLLASFVDGRASLAAAAVRLPAVRALFDLRPPARLAAARLEALRRYAVLYRLEGAALPLDEDSRLREARFSDRQAEAARALVDARSPYNAARARAGGATIAAALLAAGAVATLLIDRWLARQVDDSLSAHIMTILMVTWLVSIDLDHRPSPSATNEMTLAR